MANDVYEPLDLFRREYAELHAKNTAEFFEGLVEKSGVDEEANRATVAEVRRLENILGKAQSRHSLLSFLNGLSLLVAIGSSAAVILHVVQACRGGPFLNGRLLAILSALAAILYGLVFGKLRPAIATLKKKIGETTAQKEAKTAEAWEQMAPLNALFDWGMPGKLVEKTVPLIQMDPVFSVGRLSDLRRVFDLDGTFNKSTSVLGVQSGEIHGNPFVLAKTLGFRWGEKTYTGQMTIHWTETVRDSDGKRQTVHRSEVLVATVTKPIPEFGDTTFLLYGNIAAPDLVFSREPNELSGLEGRAYERRKNKAIKELEKRARKDFEFTMVANQEFEALFQALDRNHEQQFRLLFTPLAQEQMVRLLRDREVGFGDDFVFQKLRKINCVIPRHLQDTSIDTRPDQFATFDLADTRMRFNRFNNDYFKGLYFALAPLLSIPLYQQTRTHEEIWKDVLAKAPCFWEHEALANYHGEAVFRHPSSITRNILKTELAGESGPDQAVNVTAHGFAGEKRVDYVSKYGGDGRWHDVPVEWIEYVPVSRTSPMCVRSSGGRSLQEFQEEASASESVRDAIRRWNPQDLPICFRRTLLSYCQR